MTCQCCGKEVLARDGFAMHTKCMKNHANHLNGIGASRCKATIRRTYKVTYEKVPADFEGDYSNLMRGDFESYKTEALKLRALGIDRVGMVGAVCRYCMRQSRNEAREDYDRECGVWCFCERGEIVAFGEITTAHGFGEKKSINVRTIGAV